jgi:hypothetical protein
MMGTMPRTAFRTAFRSLTTLSLALVLGLAQAQETDPYEVDPPDRAARLSFMQGEVSMQPAGEEDWAPAILNRPLTTGDKLWTERDARAEIQVGHATVRLDSDTGFSFLNVDDDTIQMRMTAGVINVRVRSLIEDEHIEIATPNVALTLLRPGNYRVEVNDAGDATVVKISEGEAEANGAGDTVIVRNQQMATFRGDGERDAQFATLGGPDEFDSWSLERDRRDYLASSRSAEYVSPDVTGYEDLDEYGSWSSEREYGYVWTPTRVAVGWSPYSYGRWVWISPWGWTWIDDSPWGYAPFHYGRWAHVRNRWCWVPGPRHGRAVYAPAVVGWVNAGGARIGVTPGRGNVAWFPLGPRDVYVPPRRYSHRYVERVNVSNTSGVKREFINEVYENRARNHQYRNRAVPGGVTAVSQAAFTSSERVGNHRVRDDRRDWARAEVNGSAPDIAPVRQSRYGGPTRSNNPPPRSVVERPVVVRREPPPSVRPRLDRPQGGVSSSPKSPPRMQPGVPEPRVSVGRSNEERADRPSREQREHRERDQQTRQPVYREQSTEQQRQQQVYREQAADQQRQQHMYRERAADQQRQQQMYRERAAEQQRRQQSDGEQARRQQEFQRESAARASREARPQNDRASRPEVHRAPEPKPRSQDTQSSRTQAPRQQSQPSRREQYRDRVNN